MDKKIFAERFKQLVYEKRKNEKISIEDIARGLFRPKEGQAPDRPTLYAYMRGDKLPTIERLSDIADYFNVSTDYLIGQSESRGTYAATRGREAQAIAEYLGLEIATVERLRDEGEVTYHKVKNGEAYETPNKFSKAIDTLVNSCGFFGIITGLSDYLSGADYRTLIEAEADQSRNVFIVNDNCENIQGFSQSDLSEIALTMLMNDLRKARRAARGAK